MKQLKDIYTGKIYADKEVLAAAPRANKKQSLTFFTLGRSVTCTQLEQEYAIRGLVPIDVYTLAEYMEAHKNEDFKATQWKDKGGNWCYATFLVWFGERNVLVRRRGNDWSGRWSFGGVPEVASSLIPSEKPLDSLPLELEINGFTYRRDCEKSVASTRTPNYQPQVITSNN